MSRRALVLGATGFLGSHVTSQLVERGDDVRVYTRASSDPRGLAGLDVERRVGELTDDATLTAALRDRDVVYHCAVDTRAWLRDPAPLFATNVTALRHVLDAVRAAGTARFVFTSSVATIGTGTGETSDETDEFDRGHRDGGYVASRVAAENLVLARAREEGLPAVAMCVSNTYGPGDRQPTPHGAMIAATALGRMPFVPGGVGSECVGVADAARALLLAAEHGHPGERYIVSDRYVPTAELLRAAAAAVGRRPPRLILPRPLLYTAAALGGTAARLRGNPDPRFTPRAVRLMHILPRLDHGKAGRDLGWHPTPVLDAVAEAARYFVDEARRRREARTAAER